MKHHLRAWLVALLVSLVCPGVQAAVRLPAIISEGMVLQQGVPVVIWGWSEATTKVTVSFAGQNADGVADAEGRWQVRLAPMAATAEPREMKVAAGSDAVTLKDVLVGEVWVCSGQSNMQFGLSSANDASAEIAAAQYPQLRLFTVPNVISPLPVDDCGGSWLACAPDTAPGFSAVGYFFGRHLHRELGVPVGLISTSWGGTVAEAWTSAPALRAKLPEFAEQLEQMVGAATPLAEARARYQVELEAYKTAASQMFALEDDLEAAAKWAAPGLDDTAWSTMAVPANWETEAEFRDVDGIVWFRKALDLPDAWTGRPLLLRPGPIDEVDVTWFNGEQVGARGNMRRKDTRFWNVEREYLVPGRLVKAGRNVVAIRVMDMTGQGGLWGVPAAKMTVELLEGEAALADTLEADVPFRLSLAGDWRVRPEVVLPRLPASLNNPNQPSVLFNAMINPLVPFGIKGAIWYQGESNASRAAQYRTLLPTMIADWRNRWQLGDFTFLVVQLANFMQRNEAPEASAWAELREAQALTAAHDPHVGLALAIDIGDAADIHPRNKQDVGKRLGLAAEGIAYGRPVAYSGPVFRELKVEGNRALLSFDHTDGGLVARDGALTGFAVAAAEGPFVWAQAEIRGDQVVVQADGVAVPLNVRYGWANNPTCNLYNGAGLPAVPFRTDAPASAGR